MREFPSLTKLSRLITDRQLNFGNAIDQSIEYRLGDRVDTNPSSRIFYLSGVPLTPGTTNFNQSSTTPSFLGRGLTEPIRAT
ncbi:hypothetical protein ACE1CI_26720 [Aerosakkonemataceae cyanobacterium BLCC-F50]|uniref:Uncharacterized protein n=1 Tax=Floridaenema flaviceps BLCC-F50 TaxID=3153642 RepID=A0ABV4XZP1_9CYAN